MSSLATIGSQSCPFRNRSKTWSFARLDAQANGKARYTWSGAIPIGLLGQSLHFSGLLIDSRSLEVVQATPAVSVKIASRS